MRVKLREVKEEMRQRMHQPIPEQGRWLKQVVSGYFAYHAVPTNGAALSAFRYHVDRPLATQPAATQPEGRVHMGTGGEACGRWLPKPAILHPWPQQRFAVKHPRWEPYAGMAHVRICAGGVW